MIKQAVIIAGGKGTRLAPFTDTNPKPMYNINGKPFIYYLIEQIKSFGIYNVIILLGYLRQINYHPPSSSLFFLVNNLIE